LEENRKGKIIPIISERKKEATERNQIEAKFGAKIIIFKKFR